MKSTRLGETKFRRDQQLGRLLNGLRIVLLAGTMVPGSLAWNANAASVPEFIHAPCNPDPDPKAKIAMSGPYAGLRLCRDFAADAQWNKPETQCRKVGSFASESTRLLEVQTRHLIENFYNGCNFDRNAATPSAPHLCQGVKFKGAVCDPLAASAGGTVQPIFNKIAELDTNHPDPERGRGGGSCGTWTYYRAVVGKGSCKITPLESGSPDPVKTAKVDDILKKTKTVMINGVPTQVDDPNPFLQQGDDPIHEVVVVDANETEASILDQFSSLGARKDWLQVSMSSPPPVNAATNRYHSREEAYMRGARVRAYNCKFQKVRNQILAENKLHLTSYSNSNGTKVAGPCVAAYDDYQKALEKVLSQRTNLAEIGTCGDVTDIKEINPEVGANRKQAMLHLLDARTKLETAFVSLAACEVAIQAEDSRQQFLMVDGKSIDQFVREKINGVKGGSGDCKAEKIGPKANAYWIDEYRRRADLIWSANACQ